MAGWLAVWVCGGWGGREVWEGEGGGWWRSMPDVPRREARPIYVLAMRN